MQQHVTERGAAGFALPLVRSKPGLQASPCVQCQARCTCMFARCNSFPDGGQAPVARKLHAGAAVYHSGDAFHSIYVLRYGHVKKVQNTVDGLEQVTGLSMAGDVLGGCGFAGMVYSCDALALDDSEVCEIPLPMLKQLLDASPALLWRFHGKLAEEIVEEQHMMQLLANMRAEQRMASFLVRLGERYRDRGYSPVRFQLRMSRTDIASHLGLTIESISRLLSSFRRQGLIRVSGRDIELVEPGRLQALAAQFPAAA